MQVLLNSTYFSTLEANKNNDKNFPKNKAESFLILRLTIGNFSGIINKKNNERVKHETV